MSAGWALPDFGQDLERAVRGLPEAGDPVAEREVDAVLLEVALDEAGASPGRAAAMTWSSISTSVTSSPRWARFSAISRPMKPPPTTTARFGFVQRLEPGRLGLPASPLEPRSSHSRIVRASGTVRTEKIPGQVDAGQRRADRRRPGRQHELVVGLGGHLAGGVVLQLHGLLLRRDGDRLAVRPAVDVEDRAEHLLGRHEEARLLLDHARRRGRAARSSRTRRTARAPP